MFVTSGFCFLYFQFSSNVLNSFNSVFFQQWRLSISEFKFNQNFNQTNDKSRKQFPNLKLTNISRWQIILNFSFPFKRLFTHSKYKISYFIYRISSIVSTSIFIKIFTFPFWSDSYIPWLMFTYDIQPFYTLIITVNRTVAIILILMIVVRSSSHFSKSPNPKANIFWLEKDTKG